MNKAEYHAQLCQEFHQIYLDKNDDYGDAFAKIWGEVGFLTGYTKIADKFYRVQALRRKGEENRRVNETIRDSLMDMANYCILSVMEMDLGANEPEKISVIVDGKRIAQAESIPGFGGGPGICHVRPEIEMEEVKRVGNRL